MVVQRAEVMMFHCFVVAMMVGGMSIKSDHRQ